MIRVNTRVLWTPLRKVYQTVWRQEVCPLQTFQWVCSIIRPQCMSSFFIIRITTKSCLFSLIFAVYAINRRLHKFAELLRGGGGEGFSVFDRNTAFRTADIFNSDEEVSSNSLLEILFVLAQYVSTFSGLHRTWFASVAERYVITNICRRTTSSGGLLKHCNWATNDSEVDRFAPWLCFSSK